MTTEEKFRAAVNVIRGLPKKGSFTPSTDLMLKFYGYFKQATEGPNTTPKPYMWEVVKKVKWDAWYKLGDMTKDQAMLEYLKELNNIVETMAASGNVEEFLVGMDDFYAQVPAKDVDLCIGPTIDKIRARSSSPLPAHPSVLLNDDHIQEDDDEDNFLDSIDTIVVDDTFVKSNLQTVYANGHSSKETKPENTVDILSRSVFKIRTDLDEINEIIKKLELQQKSLLKGRSRLFGNLSPQTIAFIVFWPMFVNLGIAWLYSRKRKIQ